MDTLRLFCDVAACRSFSQAAVRHGITQSAASQRVNHLEKRLGATLIDRSVRPLALTSVGEEFARGCRELLERYSRLEARVAKLKPEPAGEVRVDAIYSAGIDLLNQVKEKFESATPKVRIFVDYKRPEQVYQSVVAERCDFGILSYPRRWKGVGVMPLWEEPMVVVCTPGHPLAGKGRVKAVELHGFPMVGFENSLPVSRHIRRYLKNNGATTIFTNVFDNVDTIKNVVSLTGQMTILPRRMVRREAAAGTLALVELDPPLSRPMGLIYPRNRQAGGTISPAAQAFVDFLTQAAKPETTPPADHAQRAPRLAASRHS